MPSHSFSTKRTDRGFSPPWPVEHSPPRGTGSEGVRSGRCRLLKTPGRACGAKGGRGSRATGAEGALRSSTLQPRQPPARSHAEAQPGAPAQPGQQQWGRDGGGHPSLKSQKETGFCSSSDFFSQKHLREKRRRIKFAFSFLIPTILNVPAVCRWAKGAHVGRNVTCRALTCLSEKF